MPGETEIQDSEDAKKWIDWIEEAIVKEYFRYYEYKNFILKSFIDLSEATIKEVVHELKLHRDVQHHPNIISFCGITKSESDDESHLKKYMLVMEFADGGSLRSYLKNYFTYLTWDDKYGLAYQLVGAVSFLHNEGIVHRDLHSGNGEQYDVALALQIVQGQREHIVPGTPEAYVKIYTDCWNDEPEERPTASKVLERLKAHECRYRSFGVDE
ncbi:unnamed protein product [Rhizophagus irregularis]|uniref:Protein kinase domain-containing protein n=1 Tax=Rhizophagus irregularis TaxID=588596 RepID=A0A916EI15_9GLOM|nr:unnamed protein product [Rhizophagus irregularis]CAB5392831.1 unnamed protein product [Rhizophagus irregularis]